MTGQQIRNIITSYGYTLADVADKLGISAQNLNSRLNAKTFKKEYVTELENLLSVKIDENGSNNENVIVSNEVWEVIKNQSESLKIKDEQMDRLITIIEHQLKKQ
jgi:transcriptional regulator with XRE-family HTH domain